MFFQSGVGCIQVIARQQNIDRGLRRQHALDVDAILIKVLVTCAKMPGLKPTPGPCSLRMATSSVEVTLFTTSLVTLRWALMMV